MAWYDEGRSNLWALITRKLNIRSAKQMNFKVYTADRARIVKTR